MSIIIAFLVNHKFRHGRIAAVFAILLAVALLISPRMMHSEGGPGDLWQTFSVNDGLGSGSVFAILPAQDGALWFGTRGGGVGRCAADGSGCARRWTVAQGLPDNDVRALLADGSGAWVGTARGLAHVDGDLVAPDSRFNGVEIWSLARGADGALLVGAGQQGVWRRDSTGAWQNLSGASPLKGNVFALWAERGGRVWAGTEQGLFFYTAHGRRLRFSLGFSGNVVCWCL